MGIHRCFLAAALVVGVVAYAPAAHAMSGRVESTLSVGGKPIKVVVGAEGNLFIADSGGSVTLYHGQDNSVIIRHEGLGEVRDMIEYYGENEVVALVLSANPPQLTAIDMGTGEKTWVAPLPGTDPTTVMQDYRSGQWLVADRANGDIVTPDARIHVGGEPIALAGPTSDGDIVVLSPTQLVLLNDNTFKVTEPLALPGRATSVTTGWEGIWVATEEGQLVRVSFAGDSILQTLETDGVLTSIDARFWGEIGYVGDERGSRLLVVDLAKGRTLGAVPFPAAPTSITATWDDVRMLVASEQAGAIYETDIRLTKRPSRPRDAAATCTLGRDDSHARLRWREPRTLPEGPIRNYKVRLTVDGKQSGRWYRSGATYMDFDWPYRFKEGSVLRFEISATSFAGPSAYARASCTFR